MPLDQVMQISVVFHAGNWGGIKAGRDFCAINDGGSQGSHVQCAVIQLEENLFIRAMVIYLLLILGNNNWHYFFSPVSCCPRTRASTAQISDFLELIGNP